MTRPIWLRRVQATFLMVIGTVLLVPAAFMLASRFFVYTVAWSPHWLPLLFVAMFVAGCFNIVLGVAVIRHRHGSRGDNA